MILQKQEQRKPLSPVQRVRQRRRLRAAIQLIFFVSAPSVYTAAFGGIKELATCIGMSDPLKMSSFVTALLGICLYTIVFGRFFCGYACAFGTLGDAVYALSQFIQKKCKKKLPCLPKKAGKVMQMLKYGVLVGIIILCVAGVYGNLSGWSPWDVFSMLTAFRMPDSAYLLGIVLFVVILVGMAIQERFFCQFLCPMGAVFALLPHLSRFTRNRENCLSRCAACENNCPVHITTDADDAHSGECISCGKCSDICPKRNISCSPFFKDGNAVAAVVIRAAILLALCGGLSLIRWL